MPTAAKLAAAVFFGALGFVVSMLIIPLFPEGTDLGWFQEVNTGIGLAMGWVVAGSRAGTGYVSAFSYGLTAMLAMVFWGLLIHSGVIMLERSLRKLYSGPVEALEDVFALMAEHGQMLLTPEILITLIGGSFLGGLFVEWVSRRAP